jgi:hypothetical protein
MLRYVELPVGMPGHDHHDDHHQHDDHDCVSVRDL